MERQLVKNIDCVIGYHTQEYRAIDDPLNNPIKCFDKKAWLGCGYYFWTDITFAKYWGEDFKSARTGAYTIYVGYIEFQNLINTVFDEDGYNFFVEKIELTIQHLTKIGEKNVTIDQVHRFLADNFWKKLGVKGIIYDDLPTNPKNRPNRIHSVILPLYYIKRIQVVAFELEIIHNFEIYLDAQYPN